MCTSLYSVKNNNASCKWYFLITNTTDKMKYFLVSGTGKAIKLGSCDIHPGCLPFDRKIRSGSRKHNGKRYTSLPQNCYISYGLNPKKGRICAARVWNREGTEKLVNGKQHSVWFYEPEWTDYLKTYFFIFGWNFRKVTLPFTLHPEFPKFCVKW